jgi:hypothetical protein
VKAAEPAKAAEPVKAEVAAPAPKKGEDPIAARIKATVAAGGVDPGKAKAPDPVVAAAADPESDGALNTEIEATTKNWAPGEKKAFTKRVYENRDLKRQVKELEGKITAAETKGGDTAALEAKLKAAEEKQQAAEAKLAAAPTAPTADVEEIKTKLTAAEKRAQELENQLQVADVERSTEWDNAVTKPRKQIADSVAEIAKRHEINPRTLQAALYGTDEEQTAAVEGLTGPEQTKFYNLALRAQEIDGRAETLRTNAAEALGKITERRKTESEQTATTQKKAFAEAHADNWKSLVEALPVLAPADGADEVTVAWNKSLETARKVSGETDFDALAPADKARMAVRSQVFPNLVGALQAREGEVARQAAEIADLTAKVAKFEANRPGAEVTPKDGDPPAQTTLTGAKGTAARIMAAVGGAGR